MVEWVKVGTSVLVGGAAGAVDQLVLNRDDKEEDRRHKLPATDKQFLAADKKLPMMSGIGTYYNYGVPVLGVFATALGWLRGDMATRVLTAGGELAGRNITHGATVKARPITAAAYWRPVGREAPPARIAEVPPTPESVGTRGTL